MNAVSSGVWSYLVTTFSQSDGVLHIYLNGVEVTYGVQSAGSGSPEADSGAAGIGQDGGDAERYNLTGMLDEVRMSTIEPDSGVDRYRISQPEFTGNVSQSGSRRECARAQSDASVAVGQPVFGRKRRGGFDHGNVKRRGPVGRRFRKPCSAVIHRRYPWPTSVAVTSRSGERFYNGDGRRRGQRNERNGNGDLQ